MRLGGGRERAEDRVDHGVGVIVRVKPGEPVKPGQPVFEVRYRDGARMAAVTPLLAAAFRITAAPPPERPLVLEEIA